MWLCGWECIYLFLFHFFLSSLHIFIILSLFFTVPAIFPFIKISLLLSHNITIRHAAPAVAARTPGVSGVPARAQSEDDSGETTSPVTCGGFQWSGSPQGPQVSIWASQGSRWEGRSNCWRSEHVCNKSGLWKHKSSKEIKRNHEKSTRPGR